MVNKHSSEELNNVFHSLANPTRRKILTRLCQKNYTVTELAEPFNLSLSAISKHIKVLEKAGLVKKAREGTTYRCNIDFEPIRSAGALVKYFDKYLSPDQAQKEESVAPQTSFYDS